MAPSQEITNWKVWCITKITIKIIKNSFILKFKIIFWQKFYTNYNVSWPLWFEYKVNNSPLLGSKNSRKKKSNPHVFRGFHLMCGISVSKGYFPTTCNENNLFFFFWKVWEYVGFYYSSICQISEHSTLIILSVHVCLQTKA